MTHLLQTILRNYLRYLAYLQIQKFRLISKLKNQRFIMVGLTASAGKTSTVQACEAALKDTFKVKTNQNYNSEYGLPANILGQKLDGYSPLSWAKASFLGTLNFLTNFSYPEIYLIEMDVDGPDEPLNISYLLKIVQPDISIHLNVNTVHTQNFDKLVPESIKGTRRQQKILDLMCQEQAVLTKSLEAHQIAILNPDDPLIWATRSSIKAKIIPIQKLAADEVFSRASDSESTASTKKLVKEKVFDQNYIFPKVYEVTFGTALTLAHILGIPKSIATDGIKKYFTLPPSRASLFAGKNNSLIIDSSYNASPQPMSEFLDLLKSLKTKNNKTIAILGDMRELGNQSAIEHKKAASKALQSADLIITIGPLSKKYYPNHPKIKKFLYYWQAVDFLNEDLIFRTQSTRRNEYEKQIKLKENLIFLIKGSQNTIYTEEIVVSLLQNPEDTNKVCRQTSHWKAIKQKFYEKNK